jgi:hypothetical protein
MSMRRVPLKLAADKVGRAALKLRPFFAFPHSRFPLKARGRFLRNAQLENKIDQG